MTIQRARQMRKEMSQAEATMWSYLKTLRSQGFHFRRQVPLGPYYADFACHHARLVIEIDGETHFSPEAMERDRARDRFLHSIGYRTIRYTNDDILQNIGGVATHVLNLLALLPLRPGMSDTSPSTP